MKKIYILLIFLCLFVLSGCNKHHFEVIEYVEATCTLDGKEIKEFGSKVDAACGQLRAKHEEGK